MQWCNNDGDRDKLMAKPTNPDKKKLLTTKQKYLLQQMVERFYNH